MKNKLATFGRTTSITFGLLILLSISIGYATTATNPSTSCNGQWASCTNAFADDSNRATANVNQASAWTGYGFSIPNSATINSVRVRSDFFATNVRGYINVKVSSDGGATYGPVTQVGGNTAEQTFWINVTNQTTWNSSKLSNNSLRVNATCVKVGSGSNPSCRLDYLPIEVSYTEFDFSMSSSPTSATANQARNANTTVTSTLLGGNSRTVSLNYSGCPTNAVCGFSTSSGTPTFGSTFTVQVGSNTPVGSYIINLTGKGDSKTRSTLFTLNVTDSQPVATASATPTSGISPLDVNFTGSVSGGDTPLSYFWNFMDGTNSTSQNPQHTFSSAGTYNVSFTATDFDSDASTGYVLVTVNAPFDFSLTTSPSSASAKQARSANTTISVTLLNGTSETVTLSYAGCPTDATCGYSTGSGSPAFNSVFTVQAASTTPTGSYLINLTGTSASKTHTTMFTLNVTDSQPVATPSATPSTGDAPLTVNFTGSVSGGDAPLSYFWNFMDGTNSTSQNPQHTYTSAGAYNVSFTATDFDGDASTGYVLVTVNTPFNFSLSANPVFVTTNQKQNITTNISVDLLSGSSKNVTLSYAGCPTLYATCGYSQIVGVPTFGSLFHVWVGPFVPVGQYLINLTGTGDGKTRMTTFAFNVTDSSPIANASATPTSGASPLNVSFFGSGTGGEAPLTYSWTFGDLGSSTEQNPSHVYTKPANATGDFNYTAQLTVRDYDSDSSAVSVIITVN